MLSCHRNTPKSQSIHTSHRDIKIHFRNLPSQDHRGSDPHSVWTILRPWIFKHSAVNKHCLNQPKKHCCNWSTRTSNTTSASRLYWEWSTTTLVTVLSHGVRSDAHLTLYVIQMHCCLCLLFDLYWQWWSCLLCPALFYSNLRLICEPPPFFLYFASKRNGPSSIFYI